MWLKAANPCLSPNQTFLLKMISLNADGTTSMTTSVPCTAGSSSEVCMMQVSVDVACSAEAYHGGQHDDHAPICVAMTQAQVLFTGRHFSVG